MIPQGVIDAVKKFREMQKTPPPEIKDAITNVVKQIPQQAYNLMTGKTVPQVISDNLLYNPQSKRPLPASPYWQIDDANKIKDPVQRATALNDVSMGMIMGMATPLEPKPNTANGVVNAVKAVKNLPKQLGGVEKTYYRATADGKTLGEGQKWAWTDKVKAEEWAKRNYAKVVEFTVPDNAIDPIDLSRMKDGSTDRFMFDTSKAKPKQLEGVGETSFYHYSDTNFDKFDKKFLGSKSQHPDAELGFWFFDEKKPDGMRALRVGANPVEKEVIVPNAKIMNFNPFKETTTKQAEDLVKVLGTEDGRLLKGQEAVDYVKMLKSRPTWFDEDLPELLSDPTVAKELKKLGYDGIQTSMEGISNQVMLFDPNKYKMKSSSPLLSEASKYKSAEEFVKAQGTPVYRGEPTTSSGKSAGIGKSFTTDKKIADVYGYNGKVVDGFVENKDILRYNELDANTKQYIKAIISERMDRVKIGLENENIKPFEELVLELGEIARIKNKKAIDISSFSIPSEAEIRVLDPNALKTKSQLTDLYNKSKGGK